MRQNFNLNKKRRDEAKKKKREEKKAKKLNQKAGFPPLEAPLPDPNTSADAQPNAIDPVSS